MWISLFGIFASSVALAATMTTTTAQHLIDHHVEATGGRVALLGLKSISRVGKIEIFSDQGKSTVFSYRTDLVYPTKLREEIKGNNAVLVDRGTDGFSFWKRDKDQYQEETNEDQKNYLRSTAERANRDILWIKEEFDVIELISKPPSWAKNSQCLTAKKDEIIQYFCFEKETGLLVAKGGANEYRLFQKWTKTGRVMIPFRLTHFQNGKKTYEIVLTEAVVDQRIEPSRFLSPKP